MQEEISLFEIFRILKDNLLLIILSLVSGIAVAIIVTTFFMTPRYTSSTQLLVNHTPTENTIQQSEINANIQLINTYEDIIRNPIILDQVRENLTLNYSIDNLRDRITIQTDQNSQVFSIRVEDENPYLAANIANETADVFSDDIDEIMNVDNVSIISTAIPEEAPSSPNLTLNILIGAVIGGFVGIMFALIREMTDTSVKDESFIIEEIGWVNLGRISVIEKSDYKKPKESFMNQEDDPVPSRLSRK